MAKNNFIILAVLVLVTLHLSCLQVPKPRSVSIPASPYSTPSPGGSTFDVFPGKSIGRITIGDTLDDFLRIQPLNEGTDSIIEERRFSDASKTPIVCPKEYHQLVHESAAVRETWVYFHNDLVSQIESTTDALKLFNSRQLPRTPQEVRDQFPDMRRFVLRNSAADHISDRDIEFLVDQQAGIAFEIIFKDNSMSGSVYRVIVFDSGTIFRPSGCVVDPQIFEEVRGN
jgi:hypothetical protein